jgi:hypothetical protein
MAHKSNSKKTQRAAAAKYASTCTRLSKTEDVAAAVLNMSLGEDEGAAITTTEITFLEINVHVIRKAVWLFLIFRYR